MDVSSDAWLSSNVAADFALEVLEEPIGLPSISQLPALSPKWQSAQQKRHCGSLLQQSCGSRKKKTNGLSTLPERRRRRQQGQENGQVVFVAATMRKGTGAGPVVWAENFISGASASALSKCILQPFDTTKTILQASKQVRGNYTNFVNCAVGLVQTNGFPSLYRGLLASLTVSAPSSAVFFTAYEYVKRTVEGVARNPNLPLGFLLPVAPIFGAALGNMVSSIVRVPPEVIKQRVQAGQYSNMFQAVTSLWAKEGLRGFYTGYSSMVARDIPYAAVQFTVFEALKRRRMRRLQQQQQQQSSQSGAASSATSGGTLSTSSEADAVEDKKLSQGQQVLSNMWMGAVSGALASVITSPIDVVKTRVMTQRVVEGGAYLGMRQTFIKIWAEEGIVAFGRGLAPRVLYKVPSTAVFLVCYEGIKRILRSARAAREKAALRKLQKKQKKQEEGVSKAPSLPLLPSAKRLPTLANVAPST